MSENKKKCPENPMKLAGMPIGMYHCPICGMMLVAGIPDKDHESGEETNE